MNLSLQVGIISFRGSFHRRRGWSMERDGWMDRWRSWSLLLSCPRSELTVSVCVWDAPIRLGSQTVDTICYFLMALQRMILFTCLFHVGFNFSSSGREDVDVRTLGNGKTQQKQCISTLIGFWFLYMLQNWGLCWCGHVIVVMFVWFLRSTVCCGAAEPPSSQIQQNWNQTTTGGTDVYPKIKMCWKRTHPQVIQDVDEFVSLENVALHHVLSNGSSAVNGCRQNESPNSW